ncbi:MAG: hypothetical protein ACK41C_20095 [Phenylobacterium sp.]|uniref:hypothetical protein n=1 Tax=Phenylobacterium sp. TaxID=1871053 RepID=UPI00391B72D2
MPNDDDRAREEAAPAVGLRLDITQCLATCAQTPSRRARWRRSVRRIWPTTRSAILSLGRKACCDIASGLAKRSVARSEPPFWLGIGPATPSRSVL